MEWSNVVRRRFLWSVVVGVVLFGATVTTGQNVRPVADAGLASYVATDPVQLDGSGSYDPDASGSLSYTWRQVSGPAVAIIDEDTATPTVAGSTEPGPRGGVVPCPFVQADEIQVCEFELVVSDGQLESPSDTVALYIVPPFGPVTLRLEATRFDPDKPTVIFFGGGDCVNGGGTWGSPAWAEKANVIGFASYGPDGGDGLRTYYRYGDMLIVYLNSVAPRYTQPIQTMGWSTGGQPAVDAAIRLNVTYADARYAVNHVTFLDATPFCRSATDYSESIDTFLASAVDGEPCWIDDYTGLAQGDFAPWSSLYPSMLRVRSSLSHSQVPAWYANSLTEPELNRFAGGAIGGAYWSVIGPGRNLQPVTMPGDEVYRFEWFGSTFDGYMELVDETTYPGRLPEPVTLGAWVNLSELSGDIDGAVLSCHESENAASYQLLFGSDPLHVADFSIVSETTLPPMDVVRDLPSEETWWTIRVRDEFGSTIHADPIQLDLTNLAPLPVANARTGRRYGLIGHAILDAGPGDEILLDPAIYEEHIAFGAKPVTIRSLDPDDPAVVAETIITTGDDEATVTFSGPECAACLLVGLTIQSSTVAVSCGDTVPTLRQCVLECPDGIAISFWHDYEPQLIDCMLLGPAKGGGTPGLLAYWKFDETEGSTAYDSEGDFNAATVGDPVWQPDAGMVNGALALDGDGDAVVVSDHVLNPGDGPFSVLAWVQGGAPGQVLVSQLNGVNWLMADPSAGRLMTELLPPPARKPIPPLVSETVITDGDWHRVAFVWDGQTQVLYVDEMLVAEAERSSLAECRGGLRIGCDKDQTAGTFFAGLIDDVRIYSRAVRP